MVTESVQKRDVIYIDLDALLDTRLGTLASLNEQFAFNAMEADYFKRTSDTFPDVSHELFQAAYARRDVSVLKKSFITNILVLLAAFVKSSIEDILTGGQNNGIEICVNTYPYELNQEERTAILLVLQTKLGEEVEFSSVSISNKKLTPMHCRTNYAAMVRYHFHDWLEMHVEEWKTVTMPQVAFYAPALYTVIPTESQMREFKTEKIHPFQATEIACASLFSLRLLDVELFCISNSIRARKGVALSGSDKVEN